MASWMGGSTARWLDGQIAFWQSLDTHLPESDLAILDVKKTLTEEHPGRVFSTQLCGSVSLATRSTLKDWMRL